MSVESGQPYLVAGSGLEVSRLFRPKIIDSKEMNVFLDYFALVILFMGLMLVFYGFVYIHDLPHKIAKKREHPHEEAIHVACWLSLFTFHAIWPIVYIWAVSHKIPSHSASSTAQADVPPTDHTRRLAELEARLLKLEGPQESNENRRSQ